jgi:hypothetical protein
VTVLISLIAACGAQAESPAAMDIRLEFQCPAAGCAQEVTLQNTGTAALVISAVRITGPNAPEFRQTSLCADKRLAGGESCSFEVFFTPGLSSTSYAQLTVNQTTLDLKGELRP